MKAVTRKFIGVNAFIEKEETQIDDLTLHLEELERQKNMSKLNSNPAEDR